MPTIRVSAPTLESAEADYERAGFHVSVDHHGALTIVATSKPDSPRTDFPLPGKEFEVKDELFIQCALNVAVFGPSGSIIIDPTERGLIVHQPGFESPAGMRIIAGRRKIFRHGFWLIDVLHGLDKETAGLSRAALEETFSVARTNAFLVVERKYEHAMPEFRSRYSARMKPDGSVTIVLMKRRFALFPSPGRLYLDEVLVKAGILGFFGIELKFKKK